jgi:preprotein translocase subunit SecD
MYRIKKVLKNGKVIILFICIILALVAIHPNPAVQGVAIRNVISNSSANLAGIASTTPNIAPMSRERVITIDNTPIKNVAHYYEVTSSFDIGDTVRITTNKGSYKLTVKEKKEIIELNETETKTITEVVQYNKTVDGEVVTVNETKTKTITVPKTKVVSLGAEDIGLRVYEAPTTNIRKGLDLQGGTRVLLQPEEKLDESSLEMLLENMKERLNVYGLSDIVVRKAGDLSGNQYILVEIPGVNEEEVRELLAKQGKFEAKVANQTVFIGGKDVTYVCRSADCSGIDPTAGCGRGGDAWYCRFRFSIALSEQAAQRQADATKDLEVLTENNQQYLSEKIYLYLDDKQVDELNIGAELKGRAVTDIQISGSGLGPTKQEAAINALQNMKRLQTILITGSLPVKINIIKTDSISPILGEEFVQNALLVGLLAILSVVVAVFIRYRKIQVALPLLVTSTSEVLILLGFAAIANWNLDLAAIAGIIIAVGTGVDHQIVITDETLRGEIKHIFNWKERIKNAFSIILIAYLTTVVAMIPLMFAGAGLLKGFALTTIFGVSIGVFITRPAYAATIETLLKK